MLRDSIMTSSFSSGSLNFRLNSIAKMYLNAVALSWFRSCLQIKSAQLHCLFINFAIQLNIRSNADTIWGSHIPFILPLEECKWLTIIFSLPPYFFPHNNLILTTNKKVLINCRVGRTYTSESISIASDGQIDEDSRVGETKSESRGINKGNSSQALSCFHLWRLTVSDKAATFRFMIRLYPLTF
jgi:hypothetical protein